MDMVQRTGVEPVSTAYKAAALAVELPLPDFVEVCSTYSGFQSADGGSAYSDRTRGIGSGSSGGEHGQNLALFRSGQSARAATNPSAGAGSLQARQRALAQGASLEVGEGAEQLHQLTAGRRCRVHGLGNGAKRRASTFDPTQQDQQIRERSAQAIELADNQRVAGAQAVEQSVQLWAIPASTRADLLEHLRAPGRLQGEPLSLQVLLRVGCPRVAEFHGFGAVCVKQ